MTNSEILSLKSKLFSKLLSVKKKVEYLKKDTKGFNYEYVSPETVLGALNPLLNEAGVFLKTEVIEAVPERIMSKLKVVDLWIAKEKEQRVVEAWETLFHLTFRFTWVDVETGFEDSAMFTASGINNDEQGQGSAQTYAERYFLLKTFNIPTGKDDPDALSHKRQSTDSAPDKPKPQVAASTAPWISDKQVQEAIARIESGEEGVVEEMVGKFRISKANRAKLEAAAPIVKTEEPAAVEKKRAKKEEKVDPNKELVKDGNLQPNTSFDEPTKEETALRKKKAVAFFKTFNDEPGIIKYLIKEEKLRYASIEDFVEKEEIGKVLEIAQRYKASVKS